MDKPLGSVMVVGSGIAGMQASLDLADSGYKVHLVEKKSAIGGHMAQLDKTFPTNDCSMCTISPRLVEVSRHLNIDLSTDTELLELEGEAGNFTATISTKPRFIDVDICNGCGRCAEVCPVPFDNPFDVTLGKAHAAHKLYPQATPNAFAIEKRGVAPCRDACPAGQRAQGYIALVAEGRIEEAYRSIKVDNPFPAICGRICNAVCEDACTRKEVDEAINIRALKRFVSDTMHARPRQTPQSAERKFEDKIAIIGSGPCGLTAAQDLCLKGYEVTVFESLPVAGGMLRVGVPEYRLPVPIIEREIQDIVDLGVDLRLNSPVTQLDDLFDDGFSAVLISVGAHEGKRIPLPGNDLNGVLINTDFLRDVRLWQHQGKGNTISNPTEQIQDKRVVVIGGGDVAVDVARSAVRLGAAQVALAMRELEDAIPASDHEIIGAREEGISIRCGLNFLEIINDGNGHVAAIEVEEFETFELDDNGREIAVTRQDSQQTIDADIVIFSAGQNAGLGFIPDDAGISLTPRHEVDVLSRNTYATSRPGVFAAGDAITGTAFVIDAVASGHKCGNAIHRYLRGEDMDVLEPRDNRVAHIPTEELQQKIRTGKIKLAARINESEIPVDQRKNGFAEVQTGLTMEQAMTEAKRCLSCGICSECNTCVTECGVGAINLNMSGREQKVDVGAVVLAPGFKAYQAELSQEYGLGRFPNVVTSLQYERLLSASGPTSGHVKRPADQLRPKKIAFLQCVGSRDQTHDYCSSVCCMYAAKQANMTIEHDADTEIRIFMMDMRAFSKNYESYYQRTQERKGIEYTRCRISSLKENPENNNLVVKYFERAAVPLSLNGVEQNSPGICEEEFDMVVLSVGMEIAPDVRRLGEKLNIRMDKNGFCQTEQYNPLQTSRAGIYAVGPFREPKDITDSIIEASGAAAVVGSFLARARDTQTREEHFPTARDITGEEARTAVFVCHCGKNIAGTVDVKAVQEYAETLPGVVHTEDTVYACSQDSIIHITERLKETGANRLVIASCSPLTHAPLFESSMKTAGLSPYMFDMANIRNQCSWVHADDKDKATEKAKELVRMSVARTKTLDPLTTAEMPMTKSALVIGGGASGMTSALTLADQGYPVVLVEKSDRLGGNLLNVHFGIDEWGAGSGLPAQNEKDMIPPQAWLAKLVTAVYGHPRIDVHMKTELAATSGFMGNFTSTLAPTDENRQANECIQLQHGVVILATGGKEYRGDEYGYGTSQQVVTGQEFEKLLATHDMGLAKAQNQALPDSLVMILCVGPADKYCARICCTTALKNALALKKLNPAAQVTVLYKDIRTYGFKERLYTKARESGVVFIQYDDDNPPDVRIDQNGDQNGQPLQVSIWESIIGKEIVLKPDMLMLSNPIIPSSAAGELSDRLKIQLDTNGFFLEAHVKLRPVDFASEGMFMAGIAHYPKLLDESIVQAQAAAARAATLLSHDTITTGGKIAIVNQDLCVGCLTCVRSCVYGAPRIRPDLSGIGDILGAANIEAALCQGCGVCAAACPAGAIEMMHSTTEQMMAKIDALFEHSNTKPCSHELAGVE